MRRRVIVKLADPVDDGRITEVVIREPSGAEFNEFGDPYTLLVGHGVQQPEINMALVRAYLDRCVERPDPLMLGHLSLRDAMAVRKALLDFFRDAAGETSTQPAAPAS